jgi:hypothetical protein
MAKYRAIYEIIWKDPDFQDYDPSRKLLFIYLCTNGSTTESGIYPITVTTISNETGIPKTTVGKQLANGLKNVIYDFKNQIVFVRNFRIYNAGGRPELIQKSIVRDFRTTFETPLWNDFLAQYPEFHDAILTVGKPLANYDKSVPSMGKGNGNSNSISMGNSKETEGVQGEIPESVEEKPEKNEELIQKGARMSTQVAKKPPDSFTEKRAKIFTGLKERRGYNSPQAGAEAQAVTWMLKQGYGVEQIMGAYDKLKQDEFWRDKLLNMQSVKAQIGEIFRDRSKHGQQESGTGRGAPAHKSDPLQAFREAGGTVILSGEEAETGNEGPGV